MINLGIFIGRLTKDPTYKYFESTNKHKCTFKIAVPEGWFSDKADFIPVVVWGNDATKCRDNLSKGNWIAVQGRFRSRNFKNAKKERVFVLELHTDKVFFIDRGKSKGGKPDLASLPFSNLDVNQFTFSLEESED